MSTPISRHEAADAHKTALSQWISTLVSDLTDLAARCGVRGENVLVAFYPGAPAAYAGLDAGEFVGDVVEGGREDLTLTDSLSRLRFADGTCAGMLDTNAPSELWTDAVDIWSGLREAFSAKYQDQAGPGLVIDLRAKSGAVWEPLFCPDFGALPAWVINFSDDGLDPFEALLRDNDADLDAAEGRLFALMKTYQLTAPCLPAHPAGECG